MEANPRVVLLVGLFLFILPSCATYEARRAIESRQRELVLNNEAWQAARLRLRAMCPMPPHTVQVVEDALHETYSAMNKTVDPEIPIMAQALRDIEEGKFKLHVFKENLERRGATGGVGGCNIRTVKTINSPFSNDWHWDWLPSYQTIMAVHEEELRKRVVPKPYEEYMLALGRFLASNTDHESMTPKELVERFNTGWSYMIGEMKKEFALQVDNFKAAQRSDTKIWETMIITGVGFLLGGPVGAAATVVARGEREADETRYQQALAQGPEALQAYYRDKREREEKKRLEEIEDRLRQQEWDLQRAQQRINDLERGR